MDGQNWMETLRDWVSHVFHIPRETLGSAQTNCENEIIASLRTYIEQEMDSQTAYLQRRREMEGEWRRAQEREETEYHRRVREWVERQERANMYAAMAQDRMNFSTMRAAQSMISFRYALTQDESEEVARRIQEIVNTETDQAVVFNINQEGDETDVLNNGTVVDEAYAQQMIQEGERAAQAIFRGIRRISPAEWEEARRQSQDVYEQAKQAEKKALSLMVEHLNNSQVTQFGTYQCFWADGSHTKGKYTYRIVPSRHNFQVDIYTADKEISIGRACAVVKDHNRYDSALAAKMMIENYEPGFFMSANLTPALPNGCTAEECINRVKEYQNELMNLWYIVKDPRIKKGAVHGRAD